MADGYNSSERSKILRTPKFIQKESKLLLHDEQIKDIADSDTKNQSVICLGAAFSPSSKKCRRSN